MKEYEFKGEKRIRDSAGSGVVRARRLQNE